jgi:hypothetical protein
MSAALADGRDAAERACGALACDIQFCLQRHGYQMGPCRDAVAAHEACVREERERARPVGSGGAVGAPTAAARPAAAHATAAAPPPG